MGVPVVVMPLKGSASPRASASADILRKRSARVGGAGLCAEASQAIPKAASIAVDSQDMSARREGIVSLSTWCDPASYLIGRGG